MYRITIARPKIVHMRLSRYGGFTDCTEDYATKGGMTIAYGFVRKSRPSYIDALVVGVTKCLPTDTYSNSLGRSLAVCDYYAKAGDMIRSFKPKTGFSRVLVNYNRDIFDELIGQYRKDLEINKEMKKPFTVEIYPENGQFFAQLPAWKGCMTQASTIEELGYMIQDARRGWVDLSLEQGLSIPDPLMGEKIE